MTDFLYFKLQNSVLFAWGGVTLSPSDRDPRTRRRESVGVRERILARGENKEIKEQRAESGVPKWSSSDSFCVRESG